MRLPSIPKLDLLQCRRMIAGLIASVLLLSAVESMVAAQGALQQRRQNRIRRQIENARKNVAEEKKEPAAAPRQSFNARPTSHSLDGIQSKGMGEFFTPEERNLVIPGFGRAPSYLIIMRQLDLTAEQRSAIQAIRRRVGNQLAALRTQQNRLEQQLEEAIYGEKFDPEEVNRLSREVAQRQGQVTVIQAGIEAQFREILTPDQFYVFRFLVGEMLLPQRRMPLNQLRQQLPRRGVQPPREDF
ncbi:MAG: Spy/CpxP family protein refolding chaperone [Blastocatellales bacterium]